MPFGTGELSRYPSSEMKYLISLVLFVVPLSTLAECKATGRENFAEFFSLFAEQKSFAIARTIYPTYVLRHEYGVEDDKEVHSVVKTPVSKSTDASSPTMNEFALKNGLQLTTQSQKGKASIVRMEKPDSDWLLTYHFVRRGSCWFLHHIEDHSL